jgi:NTE family protein
MSQTINLALQGGGAHGAFTWGALDRLLDESSISIEGISATSAGAMNAIALKHGWVENGREGAKEWLERFWLRVAGLDGLIGEAALDWLRHVWPSPALTSRLLELSPAVLAGEALTRMLSPYQFNPTNFHPLRGIVEEMVDPGCTTSNRGPRLFVSATNVRDGRPRIFQGREITTDAILASACLPTLYQAIEIDDPKTGRREAFWDGGYMGNPALYPLHYHTRAVDIVIVHINPLYREELPHTTAEIVSRINEITFNASLLRELRGIDFVNRLIDDGTIPPERMKRNFVHSVSDDPLMNQLGLVTKMAISRTLLLQLRDAGRAAMERFLAEHRDKLGRASSIDLQSVVTSAGSIV